jgi:hypothetical protein
VTRVLLPSDEWADVAARYASNPCTSRTGREKRRWPTREIAWIACAMYRLYRQGAVCHPYHCPNCGWYHVTKAHGERKPWALRAIARIHQGERP